MIRKNFKSIFFGKYFFILLLSITTASYAQIKPKALRFMLISEATTMPTYKIVKSPVHPGVLIGTDLWVRSGIHWQQTLGADISYYYHRLYEQAVMLDGTYSMGYKFNFGLQVKLLANVGYKHSILTGKVFKIENGSYKETSEFGKAQFNSKLGIGLEYPVNKRLGIRADYRYMVALPYAPEKGMPFSLHSVLSVGCSVKLALK